MFKIKIIYIIFSVLIVAKSLDSKIDIEKKIKNLF